MHIIKKVLFSLVILLLSQYILLGQSNWSVVVGQKTYVDIDHLPLHQWIPDGHISVLPDEDGKYVMYWSEFNNSRTIGDSQYPEDQKTLDPVDFIFGGRVGNEGPSNGYNDGGSWLMSVYRHHGDTLIGFYHGESHWYPRNGNFTAWKSTCLAYSYDNGYTWEDQGQIVTSNTPKPETPTWGGSGDCCVIWDSVNSRWNCYHQEHNIRLAVSYDPLGAPGTWKKYYDGEFNEDGMGGKSTPLSNLSEVAGSNPSVHWNTFLNKWVLVYYSWSGGIYLSVSNDGVNWESPRKIVSKGNYDVTQATIIGETDIEAGRLARLYYAEFSSSGRKMAGRDILFDTTSNYEYGVLPDPWEAQNVGNYNFSGRAGIRNGVASLKGTRNILFGDYDAFYFMFKNVSGSGEISAQLTSQTGLNHSAYSGIMLRSSAGSGSDFISISRKSLTDTLIISYRNPNSRENIAISSSKNWFRIKKEDADYNLFISEDGLSWDSVYSVSMQLSTDFLAGLFTTSHTELDFCTATFEYTNPDFRLVHVDHFQPEVIRIYPNPAVSILFFHLPDESDAFSYKIMDISGKIHGKGQLKGMFSKLDISELPSNQYYVVQLFDGDLFVHGDRIFKE